MTTPFTDTLSVFGSEHEDLRRSGYSREGFHSRGIRLGSALRTTSLLPWKDSGSGKRPGRGGLRDRAVGDGQEVGLLVTKGVN